MQAIFFFLIILNKIIIVFNNTKGLKSSDLMKLNSNVTISIMGGLDTSKKKFNKDLFTKEELEVLEQDFSGKYGTPNLVTDIYKVRSGEWTQVRIWSIVDLGTMRKKDLFITNSRLEPIEGFYDNVQYEIVDWEKSEEIISDIKKLNNGEVL